MSNTQPRQVVLAFFDVLGFADRVANGEAALLHEKYRVLAERLSHLRSTTYSHWLPRVLSQYSDDVPGLVETLAAKPPVEWVPAATIGQVDDLLSLHFSDTMMFWSDDSSLTNGEFVDIAIDFFCRALEEGIPLRGALAVGDLIVDEEHSIVIGGALVEAARAESAQAWCGIGLGPSLKGRTILVPDDRVLRFSGHIKPGREDDVLTTALDWTWHWRTRNPRLGLASIAETFGSHAYWQHTLDFEELSKASGHSGHLPIFDLEVTRATGI